jgi:hypothetical protein
MLSVTTAGPVAGGMFAAAQSSGLIIPVVQLAVMGGVSVATSVAVGAVTIQ